VASHARLSCANGEASAPVRLGQSFVPAVACVLIKFGGGCCQLHSTVALLQTGMGGQSECDRPQGLARRENPVLLTSWSTGAGPRSC